MKKLIITTLIALLGCTSYDVDLTTPYLALNDSDNIVSLISDDTLQTFTKGLDKLYVINIEGTKYSCQGNGNGVRLFSNNELIAFQMFRNQ